MTPYLQNLLIDARNALTCLNEASGDDTATAIINARRIAKQLAQIDRHSLSREDSIQVMSNLIELAPFIIDPRDVEKLKRLQQLRQKLDERLCTQRTRADRRDTIKALRHIDEERTLFFRRVLNSDAKIRAKRKRKRKQYRRAMEGLGINAYRDACKCAEKK